jgi:VanZ family protein
MLRYVFRYKFSILLAILIALLSLIPGSSMPGSSLFYIPHIDKMIHFSMYGLLIFVAMIESRCVQRCTSHHLLLILGIFMLSGLIEILQATVIASRGAEWFDLLANLIGLIAGYIAFRLIGGWGLFRFLRS